ncbi:hypothetical protein CYMTET_33016 [Cymbomonas tetramitiformis]|uniref:Uncharacterized protein n=1 Tax=Cymbomonas tetramitiformis TaxID=36881 RepID=A0AAE0KRC9_9CHLO|nr:hypothetical protein CYMTET_33016 [Cymbomonas tetramitiformis]
MMAEASGKDYWLEKFGGSTHISLQGNTIGDGGVTELVKALMDENCKLQHLDLSGNNIRIEGAKELAKALMDANCKLQHLNLSGNFLKVGGVTELARALRNGNCKLQHLDLSENLIQVVRAIVRLRIGDQGVTELAEALMDENCKLEHLDLSGRGASTRECGRVRMGTSVKGEQAVAAGCGGGGEGMRKAEWEKALGLEMEVRPSWRRRSWMRTASCST